MRTEVVHDDDIAGLQRGAENVVEVSQEDLSVGCSLDGHGGDHAAETHRAQDGEDLPITFGRRFVNANFSGRSCITPRHLGRDAAFIKVNQLLWGDGTQPVQEDFAPRAVLRGVALGGVERLFFSRSPNSRTTRHICVWLTATPVVRSSSSRNSRRTRSGLTFSNLVTSARSTRLGRPWRLCAARSMVPLRFCAADTFQAHGTLTPNRSANSRNVPLPAA
jgi:hypothetical protein